MKTHDIYLINPPPLNHQYIKHDFNTRVPVGLLSIGSVLAEAGYKVRIIDGVIDPNYQSELLATLNNNVLFYGISCMTAQIPSALEIGRILREVAPGKPIIWGGVHPSLFPEQTCLSNVVDIVVIGEGEYTLLDLANTMRDGKSIKAIRGIAYEENGLVKTTPTRPAKSLDDLPFPRYDIVNVENYLAKNISVIGPRQIKKSMVIYSGLGCPFNCAFCINTAYAKKIQRYNYRCKSSKRILSEIDYLTKKYGVTDIHFQDELFFAQKSRLLEIVDGLIKRKHKITWTANAHVQFFHDKYLSEELFEKVALSGGHRLTMGIESGCKRVLKILNKDIDLKLAQRSAHLSKKYGVTIGYSFMMGIPGEKRDEIIQTLKFIKKLLEINSNNYIIGPQLFRPYPGSDLYELWIKNRNTDPKTLNEWDLKLCSNSTSYMSHKELPWIDSKDYQFFDILSTLGGQSVIPVKNAFGNMSAFLRFCKALAIKTRLKLNFWIWPFEAKLLQFLRIIFHKIQAQVYSNKQ